MVKKRILLIDDEVSIRKALKEILEYEGYEIEEAASGDEVLQILAERTFDLIFLDVKMRGMDGMEVLEALKQKDISTPTIMLTGHGSVDLAVQATKLGAFDFLQKPPDLNRILIAARNALDKSGLVKENTNMRRKITKTHEILGDSSAIQRIKDTIQKVAKTEARVLITGENGTGKELVARWIHENSKRQRCPFVDVNCAAIPAELLESELFGHEKGAFTGAVKARVGKFEQANNGTLFLDEIGDMSLDAQAKVLRALQENIITRVGANETITVDVRVLAATNKNLEEEIRNGNFREDLYHRLNVIPIKVPALRERREDIPALAQSFLEELAQKDISMANKELHNSAMDALKRLEWTGNVRELRNVIERLAILSAENLIMASDVDFLVNVTTDNETQLNSHIDQFDDFAAFRDMAEELFIKQKLQKFEWNISHTADAIGMQRSHLYNKMKKYDIKR